MWQRDEGTRRALGEEVLSDDQRLYAETCALKRGSRKLSPFLEALRARISERLGIHVVNVAYDTVEIGPARGRPRLNVIVESDEDYDRLHEDPFTMSGYARELILREFAEIVGDMGLQRLFDTKDTLLIADNFSRAVMRQAAEQLLRRDRKALVNRFRSDRVWNIAGMYGVIAVFFVDEEAKRRGLASAAGERIRQACFAAVKRYDEFNYVTPENLDLRFDSKENLDRNYEGSLYYYFK